MAVRRKARIGAGVAKGIGKTEAKLVRNMPGRWSPTAARYLAKTDVKALKGASKVIGSRRSSPFGSGRRRRGASLGTRAATKAARGAGKAALRAGKAEAKLARSAISSREPAGPRYLKYGLFALAGLVAGALLARSRSGGTSYMEPPSQTTSGSATTGRGKAWGSGTSGLQQPEGPNRTGSEREYSEPSAGPLVGEERRPQADIGTEEQQVTEQQVRTRLGEDPRTQNMPRVNVEVNAGVVELRGVAPSGEAKMAAGEIAASVEGVREVRNLLTVES